ncbi:conserved hypothetical protein [Frankia canadensis]|uniref:Uncharacterized protein n=1 Tax=Frankia canadensis TaxID=1836972 RepID=A0A2I2KN20_9ACTN|nr:hypothetical protein [Frankia canadensis]SNQ47064.1 conserved hypothetical protein [Frankia canadensis]SOU54354.1 conserved hypothetical protein [Frankia canadensis]
MPTVTPQTIASGLRNTAATISQPTWHERHPGPLTTAHAAKLARFADRVERGISDDDPRLDALADYAFADQAGGCFLATPAEIDPFLAEVPEHWSPGRFLTGLVAAYQAAAPLTEDTVADIVRILETAAGYDADGLIPERDVNADGQTVLRYARRPLRGV